MVPPNAAELGERLAQVEDIAATLERKQLDGVNNKLAELQATAEQIAAPLYGELNTRLDPLNTRAVKMGEKLYKGVNQRLDNAYTYAFPYGAINPTPDRIAYGLQTGDSLGALGYNPPQPLSTGTGQSDASLGPSPPSGDVPPMICPPGEVWYPPGTGVFNPAGECGPPVGMGDGTDDGPPEPMGPNLPPSPTLPGDLTNKTCPLGPTWAPIPATYGAGMGATEGNATWHDVFRRRDGSEPPGAYRSYVIQYAQVGNPLLAADEFVAPANAEIGVLGGRMVYTTTTDPRIQLWPCITEIGDVPGPGGVPTTPQAGAECPVIPEPDCDPKHDWKPPRMGAADNGVCEMLDAMATQADIVQYTFRQLIGMKTQTKKKTGTIADILEGVSGTNGPLLPGLLERFANWLEKTNTEAAKSLKCDAKNAVPLSAQLGILGFINQWFGIIPKPLMDRLNQAMATACQSNIPSGSEANAAYLADTITEKLWECWQKANGNVVDEAKAVLNASRSRPDPAQVAMLWRRGRIDEKEYDERQRSNGVLTDSDRLRIFQLTEAWPGMEDVIRFLVRDVADEKIITRFGLDDDFQDKWQGELIRFAQGLGISGELAKLYWRAHWQLPSYTQLVEMQHRLRPGRVAKNVETTEDDVKTALQQNDMLPFWVPRLMEIAKPIMTRTDLVKGFNLRAIEDADFKEGLKDLGYDQKQVDLLFKTYEVSRKAAEARRSGVPSTRTMVNWYVRGEIDEKQFKEWTNRISMTDKEAQIRLDAAKEARTVYRQSSQVKSIKRQFTSGLIDEGTATAALVSVGTDLDQIEDLMSAWRMDVKLKGKVASAAQLCKWRNLGLLTSSQQMAALRRMGWNIGDATRIVRQCEIEEAQRQEKATKAELEKLAKAQEKAKKEAEKQRKEAEKEAKERAKNAPPSPEESEDDQKTPDHQSARTE